MATKQEHMDTLQGDIRFPELETWSDVFEEITLDKESDLAKKQGAVRSYCTLPGHRASWVRPTAQIHDYLAARQMTRPNGDGYYFTFEAINHPRTGHTLIIGRCSSFISSYWLAYVPTDTVPTYCEKCNGAGMFEEMTPNGESTGLAPCSGCDGKGLV